MQYLYIGIKAFQVTMSAADLSHDLEGSWKWFVMVGAFCTRALGVGVMYSSGPFIDEWLDYFDRSVATTTWIFSLATLVMACVCEFHFFLLF